MEKIRTILKIRPFNSNQALKQKNLSQLEYEVDPLKNTFTIQNNIYQFDKILDQDSNQVDTFNETQYLLDKFIQGYNVECFTYGTTGSGKTYSISGGQSYESRGIIPRTIEQLLSHQFKNNNIKYYVSYSQIYNDIGYDLLSYENEYITPTEINQLQQFQILEIEPNVMKFRNLSKHQIDSIEQAINILFQGDLNKSVLQTQSNNISSRSHCIFTIYMEKYENNQIITSKYNIVDLAGCERAAMHGEKGLILQQANFINVSLFHLEVVISELQNNSSFIPYRNSLLTRYLKDSLGGNSITMMIACISPENFDVYQTIQTCNFAMKIQNIKNIIKINVETDYQKLCQQLKDENLQLKKQIIKLQNNQERDEYNDEQLYQLAQQYINNNNLNLNLINSEWIKFIRFIYELLYQKYADQQTNSLQNSQQSQTQLQEQNQNQQNNNQQNIQQQHNQTNQQQSTQQLIEQAYQYCNFDISSLSYTDFQDQNFLCQIYQQNYTLQHQGTELQLQIHQQKEEKQNLQTQLQQLKQNAEQMKQNLFNQIIQNNSETQQSDQIKSDLQLLNEKYKKLNKNYKEISFQIQQNKIQLQNLKEQINQQFNQWILIIKQYFQQNFDFNLM